MKVLSSNIIIGKYSFDYVHNCYVEKSIKNLTSTGTIKLPKKLNFNSGNLKSEILKGDEVKIQLGYNGVLNTVFQGFVTLIKTFVPLEIELEDLMWKIKQIQVNQICKKGDKLKDFVSKALPNIEVDCYDFEMPKYIVSAKTGTQFLDMLKSDLSLYIFIRNNTLIIGKQYNAETYKTHKIQLNFNNVSENLEYKTKDEIKLKLTLISNLENGEKLEYEYGDDGGDSKTLNFYDFSLENLKSIAKSEYDKLIFDGFRGTITLFGEPFVESGDELEIIDFEDSDKNGKYWIDSVKYSFGINGYRQEVELGART